MSTIERIDNNQKAISGAQLFEGKMLGQIRGYYRVALTYSSNALDGNHLTELETKILLEDGITPDRKPLHDVFGAVGHAEAYDYMFSLMGSREITEYSILTLHRMFYRYIDVKQAGTYRNSPVILKGSRYPVADWPDIPKEVSALIEWANSSRGKSHPVEFAAQLHKRFVFILPFIRGNGRIARLLMNTALIQDGYLPAVIQPAHRNDYIGLLEQAHTSDALFIGFIAERELDSQKDMMRMLHIKADNE